MMIHCSKPLSFHTAGTRICVVTTPGTGFGPSGEGYIRLTAFGDAQATKEAAERIKKVL